MKSTYLNPNLPPKNLWRNLDEIAAKETADNNIIFTSDQLNTFFAAPRPAVPVNRSYTRMSQAELSFNTTYDLEEVFNSIYDIKSIMQLVWTVCRTSLTFLTQF
jgi:hypothetical protein